MILPNVVYLYLYLMSQVSHASVYVDVLRLQIKSISACNKNITRNLNYEKLKILGTFIKYYKSRRDKK